METSDGVALNRRSHNDTPTTQSQQTTMNKSTKANAAKATATKPSEKETLVAKINALNPKAKVHANMSREDLRAALKKAQAAVTEKQAVERNTATAERSEKELKAKKAAAKPEVKAEPAPVVPTPEPEPTPAPAIVLPKDKPAPDHIELEQEEKGKKRYVSKTDPTSKYHLRDRSEASKPVAIVRRICEEMPGAERKAVIMACITAGVNKNTAATQYSLWKAKKAKEATASSEDEGEE